MDRLPRVAAFVLAIVLAMVGTLAVGCAESHGVAGGNGGLFGSGRYWRSIALLGVPRPGQPHGDAGIRRRRPGRRLEPGSGGAEGTRTVVLPGVAAFTRVCAYDRPGTLTERNPSLDPYGPLFSPAAATRCLSRAPRKTGSTTCTRCWVPQLSPVPTSWSATPRAVWWCGFMPASTRTRWSAWCCWILPTRMCGCVSRRPCRRTVGGVRSAHSHQPRPPRCLSGGGAVVHRPVGGRRHHRPGTPGAQGCALRPMPLVVLAHGIPFGDPFPGWPSDKMEGIMFALQQDLAQLVPDARLVIATESGHNIHQDQPGLVIDAIQQVVAAYATRAHGPPRRRRRVGSQGHTNCLGVAPDVDCDDSAVSSLDHGRMLPAGRRRRRR